MTEHTEPNAGKLLETFELTGKRKHGRKTAALVVGGVVLALGSCGVGAAVGGAGAAADAPVVERVPVPGPTVTEPAPEPEQVQVEVTPASCLSVLDLTSIIIQTNADMFTAVGSGDLDALDQGNTRLGNIDQDELGADVADCRAKADR